MTKPRSAPFLYLTWIPRYLTGEKSCLYAAWFNANIKATRKCRATSTRQSGTWSTPTL